MQKLTGPTQSDSGVDGSFAGAARSGTTAFVAAAAWATLASSDRAASCAVYAGAATCDAC
ncbi:hypothetical protein [Burkholderia sola]|uniref:hypothetical protein n=1 Tax=Burkholderia sola TaxID=2843302 RepID=UPI001C0A7E8A